MGLSVAFLTFLFSKAAYSPESKSSLRRSLRGASSIYKKKYKYRYHSAADSCNTDRWQCVTAILHARQSECISQHHRAAPLPYCQTRKYLNVSLKNIFIVLYKQTTTIEPEEIFSKNLKKSVSRGEVVFHSQKFGQMKQRKRSNRNEATQMKQRKRSNRNEAMQMKQRKTGTWVPVLFSPRHGSIDNWHYLQQLEGEDRIQLKRCSHHRLQIQ